MTGCTSFAAAFIAVCLLPAGAAAQSIAAPGPSMTFVGAGLGVTSSDAQGRVMVTAFPERTLWAPRIEAGIGLRPRVGVGVAWVGFAEIDGGHNIARLPVEDRQREQAWVGELRARLLSSAHAAIDIVGGAGLLRQQREGRLPTCPSCASAPEPSRTSPVFTAGVDLPVRVGAHVSVAAVARVLWMRRGQFDVDTWPRDNSVEVAAFLTLRLTR